jgi:hypothetical protein
MDAYDKKELQERARGETGDTSIKPGYCAIAVPYGKRGPKLRWCRHVATTFGAGYNNTM